MDRKKNKMDKDLEKSSDIFLKKHVGLIHCENKLTLMQRKICNILLFNALDKIIDTEVHEISLRKLCSLIGYNSNDSKLIKNAIKTLISVVMEWNLLEDNKFLNAASYPEELITWNASSLLAGASIKQGMIYYSYSPQMKSVLASLDIYGRINLFVQAKFNSTYSLVLYENCVRFKNIKQTAWFPLELFRSLMGVSSKKYPSFKEFKRNIIQVGVNEVNQKADIYLCPEYRKAGRSIIALRFLITDNENYKPTFKKITKSEAIPHFQEQATLITILLDEFNLSSKQVDDIFKFYSNSFILEKINLVKTKKNISHRGAYLLAALKNDYKHSHTVEIKKAPENSYLREAKAASEIQSLKKKYMLYKAKIYQNYIGEQDKIIQKDINEKFEQYLIPQNEVYRLYNKSGLSSPFVISHFIEFIDRFFSNLIGEYLLFDDYITSDEY